MVLPLDPVVERYTVNSRTPSGSFLPAGRLTPEDPRPVRNLRQGRTPSAACRERQYDEIKREETTDHSTSLKTGAQILDIKEKTFNGQGRKRVGKYP